MKTKLAVSKQQQEFNTGGARCSEAVARRRNKQTDEPERVCAACVFCQQKQKITRVPRSNEARKGNPR